MPLAFIPQAKAPDSAPQRHLSTSRRHGPTSQAEHRTSLEAFLTKLKLLCLLRVIPETNNRYVFQTIGFLVMTTEFKFPQQGYVYVYIHIYVYIPNSKAGVLAFYFPGFMLRKGQGRGQAPSDPEPAEELASGLQGRAIWLLLQGLRAYPIGTIRGH